MLSVSGVGVSFCLNKNVFYTVNTLVGEIASGKYSNIGFVIRCEKFEGVLFFWW